MQQDSTYPSKVIILFENKSKAANDWGARYFLSIAKLNFFLKKRNKERKKKGIKITHSKVKGPNNPFLFLRPSSSHFI